MLLGTLTMVLAAAAWEIVTQWLRQFHFDGSAPILVTFFELVVSGELFKWLLPSLGRLAIGFALGGAAGVLIGLLMGYFRIVHHLLEPMVEFLRPLPSPAYIPIVILFLEIDDAMKIAVIAFAAFFPVVINTYAGVVNADPVFVDVARTLGVGRMNIALRVVLPAALPYIFSELAGKPRHCADRHRSLRDDCWQQRHRISFSTCSAHSAMRTCSRPSSCLELLAIC